MPLLFVNNRLAIDNEIETRTGTAATEARDILKQTSNDARRAQDLQIAPSKLAAGAIDLALIAYVQQAEAVGVQDKSAIFACCRKQPSELK